MLQYLIRSFQMKRRIFACKLSDDFSGFVDTCGTGKRNCTGALVLGKGRIQIIVVGMGYIDCSRPQKCYE